MYHILSMKVMTKAFKNAEKIVRKSLTACKSDESWNGNSKFQFDRCSEKLKDARPWIVQIYKDVEKIAAKEGNKIYYTGIPWLARFQLVWSPV